MQFLNSICDLPKVRDHDWSSKLYDLDGDFSRLGRAHMIAAGLGLEPRYTDPESAVLPLDDPAIFIYSTPEVLPTSTR